MLINQLRHQLGSLDIILDDEIDVLYGIYTPIYTCEKCNGSGIVGFDDNNTSILCSCINDKTDAEQDYISFRQFKQLCNSRRNNDYDSRPIEIATPETS
jgi:hypothetical protein